MRALLIAFALAFLCLSTHADVIPDPKDYPRGLAGLPPENESIAMTEEDLVIRVRGEVAEVSAEFVLENEASATSLEVGFPMHGVDGEIRVVVDGTPIPTRKSKYTHRNSRGQQLEIPWFVWPMTFRAGQKRTLVVTYASPVRRSRGHVPDSLPPGERTRIERLTEAKELQYTLHTGAYWKGPIRRCRMRVEFDQPIEGRVMYTRPPEAVVANRTVSWDLHDFEPLKDVFVAWLTNGTAKDLLDAWLWAAAENPRDSHVVEAAGYALDAAGRSTDRTRMYEIFVQQPPPEDSNDLGAWKNIVSALLDDYAKANRIDEARTIAIRVLPVAEKLAASASEFAGHAGPLGRRMAEPDLRFRDRIRELAGLDESTK